MDGIMVLSLLLWHQQKSNRFLKITKTRERSLNGKKIQQKPVSRFFFVCASFIEDHIFWRVTRLRKFWRPVNTSKGWTFEIDEKFQSLRNERPWFYENHGNHQFHLLNKSGASVDGFQSICCQRKHHKGMLDGELRSFCLLFTRWLNNLWFNGSSTVI